MKNNLDSVGKLFFAVLDPDGNKRGSKKLIQYKIVYGYKRRKMKELIFYLMEDKLLGVKPPSI